LRAIDNILIKSVKCIEWIEKEKKIFFFIKKNKKLIKKSGEVIINKK
jgi:hypothetical protein